MNDGSQMPSEGGMDRNRTRASLLLRVRDLRDRESWDEFVELYGPLILRYLRRIGVANQDALELVQDVFVIVVRHIGSFQYDPTRSFRAWLRKITVNRAFRFFAERGRWPITPGGTNHQIAIHETPGGDSEQDELIEEEWRRRCLELALKRLRSSQPESKGLQVFELVFFECLSRAEVAERLGMRVGTVYTALCRTLKRLRKILEEIDE